MRAILYLMLVIPWTGNAVSIMDLFTDKTLKSSCLTEYHPDKRSMIIGIGVGKSLQSATDLALSDIGKQLKVDIKNQESLNATRVNKKATSSYESATEITSNIKGLKGVTRECWDPNASNGRHVVVYSFDNRALTSKVVDWLQSNGSVLGNSTKIIAPNTMKNSPFLHKIKTLTRNNPNELTTLDMSLLFSNGSWKLAMNDQRFDIKDNELFELIGNKVDPNVRIVSFNFDQDKFEVVRKLKHQQEFKFAINDPEYKYVTVFNLLQDGRVSELLANDKSLGTQLVPADKELNFQAYVERDQEQIKDIYVLLFSETPILNHNFRKLELNETIGNDEYAYSIDKFLDWLDSQSLKMSIVQTTTFK